MALHENNRVFCKKTELFSDSFYGTITKIYEHAALVKVEPNQLTKKETDKIDSFGDLVVIRLSELQLVDEAGNPLKEPAEELEAAE
ncbi:hypothetical protein ACN50C_05220 [Levilactobacillus brevis]|jgi:hypothetical protein|uniref:DUF2187 domain-containing protein n=3 Tax=Levilactobacillus brevis TaxID=1580 RepID=Q03NT9_LEVBA|nr:hypothetical protein [Levilactobacillus brevis]MBL3537177.1 hypothetical protein [Lactobacillus sp. GPR40-2]MBL3630335.1 hypothetical protein [Lactobacillus sp. GPB7-4]ABJ65133.1 hypothetical protein LVIS_2077 [Levilactobacillus brevis ATCC 367]ARQ92715.1 hypothetical protein A6F60_02935 [Levilactobacillus brevis]ARW23049.1 hypothetical protein S101174_02242 [Levilactobacillus brevis]